MGKYFFTSLQFQSVVYKTVPLLSKYEQWVKWYLYHFECVCSNQQRFNYTQFNSLVLITCQCYLIFCQLLFDNCLGQAEIEGYQKRTKQDADYVSSHHFLVCRFCSWGWTPVTQPSCKYCGIFSLKAGWFQIYYFVWEVQWQEDYVLLMRLPFNTYLCSSPETLIPK